MEPAPRQELTHEPLRALLEEFRSGAIQVPEFQRVAALQDEWVRHLLASVSLGYPIGAIMLLEAGSTTVRFESHSVQGAPPASSAPKRYLVDGQHRMSSLYQALASAEGVLVEDNAKRAFYIDMEVALDPAADRDQAIVSFETDLDPRPAGPEGEHALYPLRLVFCSEQERRRWQLEFVQSGPAGDRGARAALLRQFETTVLPAFENYHIPAFKLARETTRWTVRMRGGAAGPALSDEFRVPSNSDGSNPPA